MAGVVFVRRLCGRRYWCRGVGVSGGVSAGVGSPYGRKIMVDTSERDVGDSGRGWRVERKGE
jgi:hypothetical protein